MISYETQPDIEATPICQLLPKIKELQENCIFLHKEIIKYRRETESLKQDISLSETGLSKLRREKNIVSENYSKQKRDVVGSQIVYDSQNRIISKQVFITQRILSRPSTSGKYRASSIGRVNSVLQYNRDKNNYTPSRNNSRVE